ncbi:hypothetical protein ACOZ4N_04615 [Halorientalis pallida]|uniref:hypothetical protein n=1 Tax=Halorientalis pallida TaxID=2479928 RepID=UPI003C6F7D77
MKRIAMKAVLAILAGVFGVGTAAAQSSGGSGGLSNILQKLLSALPPEITSQLFELARSLGLA